MSVINDKKPSGLLNVNNLKKSILNNAIIILLMLLVVVVSIMHPNFLGKANVTNILNNTSIRFIIALGVSGCLITRGTDLSAGRIVGLGGVIACSLLQRADYASKMFKDLGDLPVWGIFLFVIAVCALIGLINGIVIAYFKVPPFLATLGMQTIVYGANLVYSKAEPVGGLRDVYSRVATEKFFTTPDFMVNGINYGFTLTYLIAISFLVGILMWFLFNKTRHGKYMYAIGGNENAAEVSGVNTAFAKLRIYALAGCLYGLAGFLLAAKAGGASVNLAQGYELEAIAACTIGGVSTAGGVGKVQGILLGVLVFELMKVSLQFLGVDPALQFVAQGTVIIVAVALDIRKYIAKK